MMLNEFSACPTKFTRLKRKILAVMQLITFSWGKLTQECKVTSMDQFHIIENSFIILIFYPILTNLESSDYKRHFTNCAK